MVICKRLSTKAYDKIYVERKDYGVDKYLELVDICFMPHLDSTHFPHRKETLFETVKDHTGAPVYGLRDDSAVVINGNTITTIGSEPYILNNK